MGEARRVLVGPAIRLFVAALLVLSVLAWFYGRQILIAGSVTTGVLIAISMYYSIRRTVEGALDALLENGFILSMLGRRRS